MTEKILTVGDVYKKYNYLLVDLMVGRLDAVRKKAQKEGGQGKDFDPYTKALDTLKRVYKRTAGPKHSDEMVDDRTRLE